MSFRVILPPESLDEMELCSVWNFCCSYETGLYHIVVSHCICIHVAYILLTKALNVSCSQQKCSQHIS